MKKMLICLLVLLCVFPASLAEEEDPIEMRLVLSQTRFTAPTEVTVDIAVTNVSDQDMPGPMAMYYPNGKMIKEFGTPTLLAGETRTWQGTWNVTMEQLNAERVIFAVMYTCQDEEGDLHRRTKTYYTPVAWKENPPRSVKIVLKSNPSTGYSWDWQCISGDGHVYIESEMTAPENSNPALLGAATQSTYVVKGVKQGDVDICFTYARAWEHTPTMALYNLHYDIHIDEELNVSILNTRFDW